MFLCDLLNVIGLEASYAYSSEYHALDGVHNHTHNHSGMFRHMGMKIQIEILVSHTLCRSFGKRGFGVQTPSSSSHSTPDRKGHSDDTSRGEETFHEYLNSNSKKKEPLRSFFAKKENKPLKGKISNKRFKNKNSTKNTSSYSKQQRKGENPIRVPPPPELSPDFGHPLNTWVCKNSACRAVLTSDDTFCKRCSCCICHLFDDNKDPSLWLVCTSEFNGPESCGLSCHIECALQRQKAGVVDLGQLMQLDGRYCCASCGKVSGILGCWKKQLIVAKDARRVDVLCSRISLSYRLLDGTSRFKELHEIVSEAKAKLETEVGPVDGVSANMGRSIVSRLSVGADVQKLCSLALEKADTWLSTILDADPHHREDSLPAACRFQFEDVTSSSLAIVLKELFSTFSDDIKGYKLWYCKSRERLNPEGPICVFPRDRRRISISNLQPCTEYTFRIVSYTDVGDLGHSEAKCFTKSVEIVHKNSESPDTRGCKNENLVLCSKGQRGAVESSGFKVRDLGKILRVAWAHEDGCCGQEESCEIKPDTVDEDQSLPYVDRGFDLNVASLVPDLNIESTLPTEYEDEVENDGFSHETEKNGTMRSNGSGDSPSWLVKRARSTNNEEAFDGDSTLISGSPLQVSSGSNGHLGSNYEYCVKIIRWLECEGHIKQEFRMKFLTWFSLRSTEEERRVVKTFIQTLIEDPNSLAEQLLDSFLDTVSLGTLLSLKRTSLICASNRFFSSQRHERRKWVSLNCVFSRPVSTRAASVDAGVSTISSAVCEKDVLRALSQIIDPDFGTDIVSCGFVKDLSINETSGEVSFRLELTTPACPVKDMFEKKANEVVGMLPWVEKVNVTMSAQPAKPIFAGELPMGLQTISNIVAVSSCKGGVGKSTVAVNLAYTLAGMGARVGIFDADVYGPSLPTMVSPENRILEMNPEKKTIIPTEYLGVKLVSFGFAGEGRAIMRGPMVSGVINQLLTTTEWGELDYLIIDMPPGTGDIHLTLCQVAPLSAAVIVTTPQKLSFIDVAKGVRMFSKLKVPCIAVVENMCYFDADGKRYYPFGKGSGSQVVQQFGIPHLFDLPIRPNLSASGDSGVPEVAADPQGEIAKIFQDLGVCVVQQCAKIRQQVSTAVTYDKALKAIWVKVPDSEEEFLLHPATVRRNDRSAQSIDEWSGEQKLQYADIPEDIEPQDIRPMGNYAVSITWPDGFSQIAPYDQLQTMERLVDVPQLTPI
ncbi:hypothetical protein GIB67_035466 [Kingdonia uniflora]|uniref:Fe-S cluster assembly factor HCF101, chloroplastic n=1 Tax=Kingdonia uniflora TaxID=39325 RepID=A0A7J7P100_9MAGN|nr:hypothetical protein GIB67_035466 [Kingdonia uniflora]